MSPEPFLTGTPAGDPQGQAHMIGAIIQETLNRRRMNTIVALAWDGPQLWVYHCSLAFGLDPERVERSAGAIAQAAGVEACRIARGPGRLLIEVPKPVAQRKPLSPIRIDALKAASATCVAVGVASGGKVVWVDLADPNSCHLAIGGATGSGKSCLLHWLLYRLARQNEPEALRMLLLDPKGYELAPFALLPHLLHPVMSSPLDIARLLAWAGGELDRRAAGGQSAPRILVVIDEVKDLITTNPDIAPLMARIAQIGRALGIHLCVATQQPGGRSLGEALPNLPVRLIGRVASATLTFGAAGRARSQADMLLGKGDFVLITAGGATRLQVPLITGREYGRLPRAQEVASLEDELPGIALFADRNRDSRGGQNRRDLDRDDYEAIEEALAAGASVDVLRERFNLGFTRAKRIYDQWRTDGQG